MEKTKRKFFNYNNLSESQFIYTRNKSKTFKYPISAAGCIFYKTNNKQILLAKYDDPKWNRLDDLGGVVDGGDNNVFDTIIREVSEETNNVINKKMMTKFIYGGKYKYFYNVKSKYFCIVIKVPNNFIVDTSVFGSIETHDNIRRIISWREYDKVKNNLALRILLNKQLIQFFDEL